MGAFETNFSSMYRVCVDFVCYFELDSSTRKRKQKKKKKKKNNSPNGVPTNIYQQFRMLMVG